MERALINSYGTSKLFGARVGKMFSERYGVSFIAFRMGMCQRANGNLHGAWIPFGRWGQASDAARLIGFLCSEEAGWVTGQVITSSGGGP